jgi:hypothetical protein
LNFHLPLNLASADDRPVQMQKVVRRFEVMLRTELVSRLLLYPREIKHAECNFLQQRDHRHREIYLKDLRHGVP